MEGVLDVPQGKFKLQRLPYRHNDQLRAWDAADEYLLQHLFEQDSLKTDRKVLILNDSFGALGCALHKFSPTVISDSWLSQHATKQNLTANNITEHSIELRDSLDWTTQSFNIVLIKVPKTLAYFEQQLIHLQKILTADTVVIAAGMVKAMPASVWKLMERYVGITKPSLAKKKARLIFATVDLSLEQVKSPYPVYYQLENTDYNICNHANVFSRDSLDIGSRFLLQYLPKNIQAKDIVDLGCGNGVVGLMLAQNHDSANLHFVDESYMAVASAKETFQRAFEGRSAEYYVGDGLTKFKAESMDLIVCNPPFHQQNTIGNQIALSMFKQSYRVLKKAGELRVIGNRHLGYHLDLKKEFGQCKEVASNKKFVIWQAIKQN
ncbi:MAG: methyltransferase [Methylococcales bacterium]|nr:methyltransferase [Methylococcales bacterium]